MGALARNTFLAVNDEPSAIVRDSSPPGSNRRPLWQDVEMALEVDVSHVAPLMRGVEYPTADYYPLEGS